MAVTMYNAVREFSSRWYPKKGKKGIGNKNRSPIPIYVDSQKFFLSILINLLKFAHCGDSVRL